MAVNHVIINGETSLDLRADTVTPDVLGAGITAHDAAGRVIVGTGAVESAIISRTIAGNYRNPAVAKIGSYAFKGCQTLAEVDFPQAAAVEAYAFEGCAALERVDLDSAVTIGSYAFRGCAALAELNIPAAGTVASCAFQNCAALTEVNISAAEQVDAYAFKNCSSLEYVNLDSVLRIGAYAFQNCISLISMNLPAAEQISVDAFYGCSSLARIDLNAAQAIDDGAFDGCSIKTLVLWGPLVCSLNQNDLSDAVIYVPLALLEQYKAASGWADYALRINPIECATWEKLEPVYDSWASAASKTWAELRAQMPAVEPL